MALSRDEIFSLARLARIEVTDEQIEKLQQDLGSILSYIHRLQHIPTDGVPEAASPLREASAYRADEASQSSDVERAFIEQNFPAHEHGMLKVPAVFEKPKR